jgi:hypothetical protein
MYLGFKKRGRELKKKQSLAWEQICSLAKFGPEENFNGNCLFL